MCMPILSCHPLPYRLPTSQLIVKGYDYVSFFKDEEIGLATWEYAPDGRPTKLTIEHRMDVSGISNSGLYGIEFSNILTDSTTGFGLMFAIGYDEMLALPLLPNGAYFDIDYPNVQYLCSTYEAGVGYAVDYPGDMRIIKSGVYANDLLVMDWDNEKIKMINIDSTTGYPVGFDPAAIDPEAFACPFLDFIDTDTTDPDTQPWGMQFDGATGGKLFQNHQITEGLYDGNLVL